MDSPPARTPLSPLSYQANKWTMNVSASTSAIMEELDAEAQSQGTAARAGRQRNAGADTPSTLAAVPEEAATTQWGAPPGTNTSSELDGFTTPHGRRR